MDPTAPFAKLLEAATKKARTAPVVELGRDLAAGNITQGVGNFAQSSFAPQMAFGQSMMNPEATFDDRLDAFMKMQGTTQQAMPAMAQIPQLQSLPEGQMSMGNVGVQNQRQNRVPMSQGIPQGLMAQLGFRI